jgi:hypothetical protein
MILSNHICGKWLLPLHESWFEDDGESQVGCLNHKTTHTNPAHTFFPASLLKMANSSVFYDQNQPKLYAYCSHIF